jgi:hypothetical protein
MLGPLDIGKGLERYPFKSPQGYVPAFSNFSATHCKDLLSYLFVGLPGAFPPKFTVFVNETNPRSAVAKEHTANSADGFFHR